MLQLKRFVQYQCQQLSAHPLMSFLTDEHLNPRQRLFIAPCMAHFAMSLSDINRYLYRDDRPADPFQAALNEHSLEDERHSAWFLSDYKRMGFDEQVSFAEAMRFLWGRDTIGVRRTTYELSACLGGASPLEKYAIRETINTHARILFTATAQAAASLSRVTGEQYMFFGEEHLASTSGLSPSPKLKTLLAEINGIVLRDEEREKAQTLVLRIVGVLQRFDEDLWLYASHHACGQAAQVGYQLHI